MIEMRPTIFQKNMNAIKFKDCIDYAEQSNTGNSTFLARAILDTLVQFSDANLKIDNFGDSKNESLTDTLIFKVYPIPANDLIYFYPNLVIQSNIQVSIIDALGKHVLKVDLKNDYSVGISKLSSGIYTYSLLEEGQIVQIGKLVIIK